MESNRSNPTACEGVQSRSLLARLAWLPVPVLALLIAALWIADLRTVYESQVLMVLLNLFFTWLASLCICLLTARGFLGTGQPGLLMFGCGSLLWGVTSLAAATLVDRVNLTITVHNLGVFGAALCYLVGLLWRGRVPRPGRWLVVGYAGALMSSALIVWAAAELTPVFFVQGQGGTPVRQAVLLLAVVMFGWVAWQMIHKSRRQCGAFHYWYGLGLALVATGLTGVVLLSVQGGVLGWTSRLTQYLGSAYLFIAALMAARETGTRTLSLPTVEEAWQENPFLAGFRRQTLLGWALRYGLAVVAVAVAIALRLALTARIGPGLSTYITFYPAIMVAALLGGFGPGLVATAFSCLVVSYWVLPPVGQFSLASPVDRLGLVLFAGMGLFMSAVAEFHRRYRHKAAAYDREAAVRESQTRLAAFAAATFEGIVETDAGRIVDCNEQFARMAGYSVAEMRGLEVASLIASEDRDRVIANVREGRESQIEHAMFCKDGTRIVVEVHGRPVSPGSARRLTAVHDITARKQAETALQNTLQRFYDVLASMYSGLLLMTDEGRVEYANQAFCDAYGLKESPTELMGLASRDLVDKILPAFQHPAQAAARIQEILQRGQPVRVEEFDMRGGRTALRSYIPLSLNGKSCGRLWIYTDISERKRAEEALRESEVRYRTLFNTIDAGFCIIQMIFDAQGKPSDYRFLEVNGAFEKQTGLHDAQGKSMRTLTPAHEAHWFEIYGEIALTGEARHFVNEARQLNRWYDVYAYRTGAPEHRRVAILFNDITLHKQAETEIQRRVEELRAANEELTRFNRVTVGRELRIIELKQQVNDLCTRLGQPPRYAAELDEQAPPARS